MGKEKFGTASKMGSFVHVGLGGDAGDPARVVAAVGDDPARGIGDRGQAIRQIIAIGAGEGGSIAAHLG